MHNGRLGIFYLKEAVLDVLFNAPEPIGPAEISRRSGIPGDRDQAGVQYYSIVTGILRDLMMDDRVQRSPQGQGRYELTAREHEIRSTSLA